MMIIVTNSCLDSSKITIEKNYCFFYDSHFFIQKIEEFFIVSIFHINKYNSMNNKC